jgi:uncharacterized membrane protein YccF (DUF307 family)
MRFIGNIIWFVIGGWYLALTWFVGGVLFALTIVGLPLFRASIEMGKMSAFPFGKDVVHINELENRESDAVSKAAGTIGFIVNIIWACTVGTVLFLFYILAGIGSCITIIGIPFGIQSFKLAGISFWPIGRRVVTIEMAKAVREKVAQRELEKIQNKTP